MFSISTAAGLLALSSAEVFEFSDLEVATDRWFYPFNATPGDRILASTFGQDIYTVFDIFTFILVYFADQAIYWAFD